jgi:hypothetical protein
VTTNYEARVQTGIRKMWTDVWGIQFPDDKNGDGSQNGLLTIQPPDMAASRSTEGLHKISYHARTYYMLTYTFIQYPSCNLVNI